MEETMISMKSRLKNLMTRIKDEWFFFSMLFKMKGFGIKDRVHIIRNARSLHFGMKDLWE